MQITEWADNCVGQMKTWTFFCAIVAQMMKCSILVITIKYFEKGHTFMSADSFHASVERNIRQKKKLMDFNGFVECISKSGEVVEMRAEDFFDLPKKLLPKSAKNSSTITYPKLSDVALVQFRKGSTKTFWKNRHTDDDFKESEFMMKKYWLKC